MANDCVQPVSFQLTSTAQVIVVVEDVNDNAPVFVSPTSVNIPEDTLLHSVIVLYYLNNTAGGMFSIDDRSGAIYLEEMLDREVVDMLTVTVIATDRGSPQMATTMNLTVHVEDANDHDPEFLQSNYSLTVREDIPRGTSLFQVQAYDQDTGPNGRVRYILTQTSPFVVDAVRGVVTVMDKLDREKDPNYSFIIAAVDQGNIPRSATAAVNVTVLDINDFAPQFSPETLIIHVKENEEDPFELIHQVQLDSGNYGTVQYNITEENTDNFFIIDLENGLLSTTGSLDREDIPEFNLTVEATEINNPLHKDKTTVIITVLDRNDNAPRFSQIFYTELPEDVPVGHSVIQVTSTDDDTDANAVINYFLADQSDDTLFNIDPTTGYITVEGRLDREQEQIFDITIKASNTGGHTLFSLAHIVIQISDVNEFTPKFRKKEFNFSVFKNVSIGTLIGKVTATDYDQGFEGQVFYLMFGQSKSMGFEIDTLSGEIFTTNSLRKQGNSHVALKVLAKNHGVITGMDVDETLVHVSVIDTNDPPVFTPTSYIANITEDSPAGTSVVTVSALDQDSILDWNRFFFSIENGNTNFSFAIDPSSGLISVNSPLDRELWPVYNLTVTATDNGSPPATGTTTVSVTIGDVNDNAPKLTATEVQVKENQPEGTIVTRLNASDSDLPPNQGPFTYLLLNRSTGFLLTPDGLLLTTQTIDREQTSAYQLVVVTGDAGMLKPMDFVFHRVMAAYHKGRSKAVITKFKFLFVCMGILVSIISLSLSLCLIRTLDVGNNNMTIGGLRTIDFILLHPTQIKSHDFVGCIRNIHINGILLRPSMALATYNIFDR
uniref:Cadherin domain-containing protein n=1 Tax=Acanthochromis polyacanthus TaxID=80966 RepID=A0A3Q1G5Y9_9TELE